MRLWGPELAAHQAETIPGPGTLRGILARAPRFLSPPRAQSSLKRPWACSRGKQLISLTCGIAGKSSFYGAERGRVPVTPPSGAHRDTPAPCPTMPLRTQSWPSSQNPRLPDPLFACGCPWHPSLSARLSQALLSVSESRVCLPPHTRSRALAPFASYFSQGVTIKCRNTFRS